MSPEPKSLLEMTERERAKWYPNLIPGSFHKTSEETKLYNCVAWVDKIVDYSVDFSTDDDGNPRIDDEFLLPEIYIDYFESKGFTRCDNPDFEEGLEKIALYIHQGGTFEHVARQLENGHWTSKVGEYEDIEHYTLEALEKPTYYGKASIFMKRPRTKQAGEDSAGQWSYPAEKV
jgi:hypothetical protein